MVKGALIGLGLFTVLGAAFLAAVPYLVDLPAVQAYGAQLATHALGRPVRYQSLSVSALPLPALRVRGLEVSDDPRFGSAPLMTVADARLRVRLRPLLSGRIELTDLALEGVRVVVIEDGGQLNVATLGAEPSGPRPPPRGGPAAGSGAPPPFCSGG